MEPSVRTAQSLRQGAPRRGVAHYLRAHGSEAPRNDATGRLASAWAEGLANRKLTKREQEIAGTASHYGFGVAAGTLYGLAAEFTPRITTAGGLPFGAFIWIAADEGVVLALGLSKSFTNTRLDSRLRTCIASGLWADRRTGKAQSAPAVMTSWRVNVRLNTTVLRRCDRAVGRR